MEQSIAEEKAQRLVEELLGNSEWDAPNKRVSIYRDDFYTREALVAFLYDCASEVFCEHGMVVDGVLCEGFDDTWIEEQLDENYEAELAELGWNH